MVLDDRASAFAGQERLVGVAVKTHVRVVHIAEDADDAFAIRGQEATEEWFAQFKLPILAAGTTQVPFDVDSVGDRRHQSQGVARGPVYVVVFGDDGVGVATSVGRVVPRTVVIDGPVEELKMAVAADRVDVKIVGQAHPADVELETTLGHLSCEGELRSCALDELVSESDGLVKLDAGDVGS